MLFPVPKPGIRNSEIAHLLLQACEALRNVVSIHHEHDHTPKSPFALILQSAVVLRKVSLPCNEAVDGVDHVLYGILLSGSARLIRRAFTRLVFLESRDCASFLSAHA